MQVRTSVSIKFGFPNAGLDIRWGESFSQAASSLDNPWKWKLWWEVIVGNMAAVTRNVILVWTVQGVRRTTVVSVPQYGQSLGKQIKYPDGTWGERISQGESDLGEVGVWLPIGDFTFGDYGQGLVELPINGKNLSREISITPGGTFGKDPIGKEWVEVSRTTTSTTHGDATVTWPNRIVMKLPPNSANASARTLDLKLDKPLFPELKDRLGAQFAETAVFTEASRVEVEVELASGVKAKVMKEAILRSSDGTVNLKLVFRDP